MPQNNFVTQLNSSIENLGAMLAKDTSKLAKAEAAVLEAKESFETAVMEFADSYQKFDEPITVGAVVYEPNQTLIRKITRERQKTEEKVAELLRKYNQTSNEGLIAAISDSLSLAQHQLESLQSDYVIMYGSTENKFSKNPEFLTLKRKGYGTKDYVYRGRFWKLDFYWDWSAADSLCESMNFKNWQEAVSTYEALVQAKDDLAQNKAKVNNEIDSMQADLRNLKTWSSALSWDSINDSLKAEFTSFIIEEVLSERLNSEDTNRTIQKCLAKLRQAEEAEELAKANSESGNIAKHIEQLQAVLNDAKRARKIDEKVASAILNKVPKTITEVRTTVNNYGSPYGSPYGYYHTSTPLVIIEEPVHRHHHRQYEDFSYIHRGNQSSNPFHGSGY